MSGISWPTIGANEINSAEDMELKFDWIEGTISPMTGGNKTDAVYDISEGGTYWRNAYVSGQMLVIQSGDVANTITVGIHPAGQPQRGFQFFTNGSIALRLTNPNQFNLLPQGQITQRYYNQAQNTTTIYSYGVDADSNFSVGHGLNLSDTVCATFTPEGNFSRPYNYGFFAYCSSATTALPATAGVNIIRFDSIQFNIGGQYDTSTGQFGVAKSGTYLVGFHVEMSVSASSSYAVRLFENPPSIASGTSLVWINPDDLQEHATHKTHNFVGYMSLTASSFISVAFTKFTGHTIIGGNPIRSYFYALYVG